MRAGFLLLAAGAAIAIANAVLHDPAVGYDAEHHRAYVRTLAGGKLPGPEDTAVYYSPPLPYLLPALALRSGLVGETGAIKVFQLQNAACAAGSLMLLRSLLPGAAGAWALLVLLLMPAWHRSFALARGEPMLAFFAVLAARLALTGGKPLALGAALGAMLLCRQWAAFVLAGLATFFIFIGDRRRTRGFGLSLAAAALLSGWFYAALWARHGSPAAYAIAPSEMARNQGVLAALYEDFWGDRQGTFLSFGRKGGSYLSGIELARTEGLDQDNRAGMARYLSAALSAALIPTALIIFGLVLGARTLASKKPDEAAALSFLIAAVSLPGFWLWVARYGQGGEHAVKATYLLHVCPFLALLAGQAADAIRRRSKAPYDFLRLGLAIAVVILMPLAFTRYLWGGIPGVERLRSIYPETSVGDGADAPKTVK